MKLKTRLSLLVPKFKLFFYGNGDQTIILKYNYETKGGRVNSELDYTSVNLRVINAIWPYSNLENR